MIVAGDFNHRVGDDSLNFIEGAGMRPTWKDLKIELSQQFSYNAFAPEKQAGVIDHIFYKVSSGARVTDGGIIELRKPLSDHKPVWAELVFPR